jgi:peptidyl-prolyl cis-trans isomerase A (cyclophilin A)
MAGLASAQTGGTSGSTAPTAGFNRALLNPAALKERAPETFDAKFVTTKGDFVVRVTRAWAPNGADRFYNLVKNGFFDNASLFRCVPGFMVQFGLSAYPEVNSAWQTATIRDDRVTQKNLRGRITFATAGPNTRTTQVFINYADRNTFLDSQGFSPFGEVVEGMGVVDKLYSGYGEATTNLQGEIASKGKAFLDKNFPKLDSIKTATIVAPEAGAATAAPPKKTP